MSDSGIQTDTNSVEKISPGNTVEMRHGGRVLIYTLTDFTKLNHIDAYYDRAIQDTMNIPQNGFILSVHDVSAMPFTWTLHIRNRAVELIQAGQGLGGGRVALIFRNSAFLRLSRVFIEWQQRRFFPQIDLQVFFDREEGIAWVEAGLKDLSRLDSKT